jgi:hypothetical protein
LVICTVARLISHVVPCTCVTATGAVVFTSNTAARTVCAAHPFRSTTR